MPVVVGGRPQTESAAMGPHGRRPWGPMSHSWDPMGVVRAAGRCYPEGDRRRWQSRSPPCSRSVSVDAPLMPWSSHSLRVATAAARPPRTVLRPKARRWRKTRYGSQATLLNSKALQGHCRWRDLGRPRTQLGPEFVDSRPALADSGQLGWERVGATLLHLRRCRVPTPVWPRHIGVKKHSPIPEGARGLGRPLEFLVPLAVLAIAGDDAAELPPAPCFPPPGRAASLCPQCWHMFVVGRARRPASTVSS